MREREALRTDAVTNHANPHCLIEIPEFLHLVWLNSLPRWKQICHVQSWATLNKHMKIVLWVDSKYFYALTMNLKYLVKSNCMKVMSLMQSKYR